MPMLLPILRSFTLPLVISLVRALLLKIVPEANVNDYGSYRLNPEMHIFDFIVVGSGSAGSVVAARLSENPYFEVLLLEAGGLPPPESIVPSAAILLFNGDSNWNYKSVPQKHGLLGYNDRKVSSPRGRTLGGTSAINYMIYNRGNRKDYDSWAAMGNPGWDYESVLPYFRKSEDYGGKLYPNNSRFHGVGGPLSVITQNWASPLQRTFLKAGLELGYSIVDNNAEQQIGFTVPDMTIKNGIRHSTAEAFLRPNLKRPNLHILPHSQVTKIIFDGMKRAMGVQYLYEGKHNRIALAKREVIISAGVLESPKLLMLSGIGPKKHLEKHGIPVIHDLPGVGQNLRDHFQILGLTWTVNPGNAVSPSLLLNISTFSNYVNYRQGPLSVPNAVEGIAFAQLSGGDPELPDAMLVQVSQNSALDLGFLAPSLMGLDDQLFKRYYKRVYGTEGFIVQAISLNTKSIGSITLRSSNPLDPPVYDPNIFSNIEDVQAMVRVIKFALRIGNTKAFKDGHGAKFHDEPFPGCEHFILESDEYWACFARFLTTTSYHISSTCKMAPHSDEMGVVDSKLRVYGVKRLRVMDASIMPTGPSGSANAATIMVGEKGADLIHKYWQNKVYNFSQYLKSLKLLGLKLK